MLHQRIEPEGIVAPDRVEQIIALQAAQCPNRVALAQDGARYTYGELRDAVTAVAAWLKHSGVRPRDRVMLVCENSFAAVALYFASTTAGAWPVLVNARLSAREIDAIAAHCESRVVLFTTASSAHAKAHAQRLGATAIDVPAIGPIAVSPIDETAQPEPQEDNSGSDVAAIIYTTGTTGRPKGIMLTHGNLLFVARTTAEARRLTAEDRVCATLPISHSLGLSGVLLGSLLSGAELHLCARFDPARIFAAVGSGISVMIGAPSMYALLSEYAERNGLAPIAGPRLRLVSSAGAPLDLATKLKTEAVVDQTLHNGYGISECGPSISLTALNAPRADCSVGRLLPGVEMKLVGSAAENGHANIGELWVRSPGVMKGYYKASDETRQALDDAGWFKTGDLARIEDGHLFIVGRAKEMIVRFGFNVYPAEIEAVLNAHPQVLRSAVIGRAKSGTEEIVAFVQPTPGAALTPAEIADYTASRVASYKQPSEVIVLRDMPMSANGKIRKAELRSPAAEDLRP